MTRPVIPARVVPYEERSKLPHVCDLTFPLRVNDLVVIRSRGDHRLARVTKVGRTRVHTEYTTVAALSEAQKFGARPTVTRKSVDLEDPWLLFAERPRSAQ